MLSIILFGRNDNHGYNYHKRLAISLNCLSELLFNPSDEIIFVDYNTLDDQPTILQAIQDTLTDKAKNLIKIVRVPSSLHRLKKSHLTILEPIARNVALRRTNPKNKWVLSTNVDMIFITTSQDNNLTRILTDLPDGFYQLPRYELPEGLWESQFDRLSPGKNLAFLRSNAEKLRLNVSIKRPPPIFYDNPGDFQLMLRKVIFELDGFNENMLSGWHVDSNLAKRMYLYYNEKIKNLEGVICGYHCNHTRELTLLHKQRHSENSWGRFVARVNTPFLTDQRENWGLAKESLEVFNWKDQKNESEVIKSSLNGANHKAVEFMVSLPNYNTLTYDSSYIFTHLADHFSFISQGDSIAYVGNNPEMLKLIKCYFSNKQIELNILTIDKAKEIHDKAKVIIFDFGFDDKIINDAVTPHHFLYFKFRKKLKKVVRIFLKIISFEKKEIKNIKIIGINALYTDFQALFHRHLILHKASFLSRVAYGYTKKKKEKTEFKWSWLSEKKQIQFFLIYALLRCNFNSTDKVIGKLSRLWTRNEE